MLNRLMALALTAAACACAWGAAPAAADEMLAWDKVAVQAVRDERVKPEDADKTLALVRAAVDDAMNEASPMNGGLSADLAAAAAAHRVLSALFPARKSSLDRRLEKSFARCSDEALAQQAYTIGRTAADAVLESRWKWERPRVRAAGPPLPDQPLPGRERLRNPLAAPTKLQLHEETPAKRSRSL